MNILNKFAKENKMWVRIKAGESVEMIIEDYTFTNNRYGQPCIAYKVRLPGISGTKTFQSSSTHLAEEISRLPNEGKGCYVRISREGDGFSTKWKVELLSKEKEVELDKLEEEMIEELQGEEG